MAEHLIFSIRLPKSMVEEIESKIDSSGHSNRNDFVRSAIRFYLQMLHEKEVWEKENQADTPPAEIEKIKTM